MGVPDEEIHTMQSNNPVFRNSDEFKPGYGYNYGAANTAVITETGRKVGGPMTIDSVVQATGVSIGVVIVAAIATWVLTPQVIDANGAVTGMSSIYALATIGSLGAFILSMVNSFKRVASPALVVAFAAFEGVALGGLSKVFDAAFGSGVVSGAVIGTFAAFGGTLAAYKFLNIKVGDRFRTIVQAAMFGMVGLALLELVLSLFGNGLGLFGFGPLGFLTAVIGLVLGVFMLVLDFDYVQQGIRNHIDARESWRAAFALTVSLVWIYTNLLRILSILRGQN